MHLTGALILSVDAKKTELIGNYRNNGREWIPTGTDTKVNTHDFGDKDGKGNRIKAMLWGPDITPVLLQKIKKPPIC
jgi:hypothetical protein